MADNLIPDLEQARRFLEILDPGANTRSLLEDRPDGFTFQTFDDSKTRKDRTLARILTGTLDSLSDTLVSFNKRGAGIFVTVNETDGRGRKISNLERVRCCWIEDDEGLGIATPVEPHLVTETSPGKYHKLFLVDGLTIEQHAQIQEVLVAEYGSDPNAKDVVRVLRPAGFYHMKGEPFMVRIIHESGKPPYSAGELLEALKPNPNAPQRVAPTKKKKETSLTRTQPAADGYVPLSEDDKFPLPDINEANAAKYLPEAGEQTYFEWLEVGFALHHQFSGSDEGLAIFDEWSQNVRKYQGFDDVAEKWANFGNRTEGPVRTFKCLVQDYHDRLRKDKSAQASSNADKATKLLSECTDYNILVTDIAGKLWRMAQGNVALEKDFKAALIMKYAELRPGHTLTSAEALRAMKSRSVAPVARTVSEIEVNYADAPSWSANWVWISEEEVFFNTDTRGKLTNSGFRSHYDCMLPVGEGMPTDAAKFVRNNNYIPKVMRSLYAPNLNPLFDYNNASHVNTYSPNTRAVVPESIQRPDAVATFKRHIELICGGWNREAMLLCNYLTAVTAERPLKVRWAPLIIGEYGDGKSSISTFIDQAVGEPNSRTIHGQTIMASASSAQTGWAEGAVFCTIEEVKFHGHNRHDALNLLKTYITNDRVNVRKLYQETQSTPNTQNYILYSNYKDAAPIDKGDRRYFILFSKLDLDKMKEDKTDNSYFDRLNDAVKNDAGDIMLWLRTVPVHPDFHPNGHAPMTDDKQTVLRIVKDDLIEELHEMLEDSKEPLYGPQVVSFTPLFNAIMVRSNGAIKPNEKHKLTRALLELGFTKLDRCRLPVSYDGDNRHALWARGKDIGENLEVARAIVIERHNRIEHTGLGMDDLL